MPFILSAIPPRGVVALNIMRDQLDRFGEIDATAKLVERVTATATSWAVLNANDPRIAAMADQMKARPLWFGDAEKLLPSFITDDQHHHQDDANYFIAQKPDVLLDDIKPGSLTISTKDGSHTHAVALDGAHNAINIAAALAVLEAVIPNALFDKTKWALERMQPAFGRGERIKLNSGSTIRLQLVKNPAGFTHALHVLTEQKYDVIGIVINDDYADGRDVSWLWDVDFVILGRLAISVVCGGSRAYDMAVRLKYDDVIVQAANLDIDKFLAQVVEQTNQQSIIFCTYTAMLKLRKQLKRYSSDIKRSIA